MDNSARENRSSQLPTPAPRTLQQRCLTIGLLFLSFLAYSLIRTPIPAVNEPHYLAKAKHFWDSTWCPGDLFLESSNPHFVFYAVVGSSTRLCSLEQTAWIARIAALLLLAIGFESLLSIVLGSARSIVAATWLYLGIAATGNLSGEWIVGGVEGKVFAYGFAIWGAGQAARDHLLRAAVLLGLAVSFHPIVGIWCLCATLAGLIVPRFRVNADSEEELHRMISLNRYLAAGICFSLCALAGLLPALQVLGGVPADIVRRADEIQVFERLKHHLDPAEFSFSAYASYAVMFSAWIVLRKRAKLGGGGGFLHWYLLGSAVIALGGLFVGLVLRNPALMKFYPFRLFDVILPLAMAVLIVRFLELWAKGPVETADRTGVSRIKRGISYGVYAAVFVYALTFLPSDRRPENYPAVVLADWIESCRWISAHTPHDAQVLTPSYAYAFKWYGGRAEYVNYKDCPQDAVSLVEWKRRYELLRNWEPTWKMGSMSRGALSQFADRDQIDYLIAPKNEETDLPVAHRGEYFWVYDVRGL